MTHTEQLVATIVHKKPSKTCLTDAQWEFVYELWCFGYPIRELSGWLLVAPSTIDYNFHRLGFTSAERLPLSTYDEKFEKLGGDTDARSGSY